MNDSRQRVISALFAKAAKMGVDADVLRNEIAPAVIGKRISEASARELCRLLDHLTGAGSSYDASLAGLKGEVIDLARARFGKDYEMPLNALCARFGVKHHRWLRLRQAKAVKATLLRLQKEGPYEKDRKKDGGGEDRHA